MILTGGICRGNPPVVALYGQGHAGGTRTGHIPDRAAPTVRIIAVGYQCSVKLMLTGHNSDFDSDYDCDPDQDMLP